MPKRIFYYIKVESAVELFEIAKETEGFSGSDLKEMCRDAALLCVRDFVHNNDGRYVFKMSFYYILHNPLTRASSIFFNNCGGFKVFKMQSIH